MSDIDQGPKKTIKCPRVVLFNPKSRLRRSAMTVSQHGTAKAYAEGSTPNAPNDSYDVVVVGGGAAGIGAAIGAKQTAPHSRVLIIESEACLGGAATHRGVLSYCGLYSVGDDARRAVGSIWTELHSRLVAEGAAHDVPDRVVAYVQVRDRSPEDFNYILMHWL